MAESNKNPESASQVGAPVPPLGRDGVAICSFEQAFAVLPVIVWESDWTGPDDIPRLTYVSASAERILGYPIHLWLEDPSFIISIIHPEDRDRVAYDVQRSSALSGSPAAVFRCLAADGGVVWLEGRYAATYDGEGRVIGLRGVNIDVTDRMRAEAELRDIEVRFRRITEATAEGIVAIDAHGHPTYINGRVTEMLGYTLDDVQNRHVFDLMDPPIESLLAIATRQAGWGDRKYHEVRLRHRDGSTVWVSAAVSPDYRDDGSFASALCLLTDITEQKRAGEALRRSEGQYRLLAENAVDIIIRYDRDLRCLYANRAIESVIGLESARIIGRTMTEIGTPAETVDFWRRQIHQALDTGREHSIEFDLSRRNGLRHFRTVFVPEITADGSRTSCLIVTRDLTEQKRLEERQQFLADANIALARSLDYEVTIQSITRLVVPRLADGCLVFIFDDDGTVRIASAAHEDPDKEFLLRQLRLQRSHDRNATGSVVPPVRAGHVVENEASLDTWLASVSADEKQSELLCSLGVVSSMNVPLTARGRVIGAMILFSAESSRRFTRDDLTFAEDVARRSALAMDNARLYQEVRHMNQAKDEFLAVLSHELRNPLAAICNALYATSLDEMPAHAFQEVQADLKREVRGMSRLVEDLLDVSRITRGRIHLRPEPRDLGAAVRSAAETVQGLIADRCHTLVIPSGVAPLMVHADPVRLEQVVCNLLNNAAKYTAPGGRIVVDLEREDGMAVMKIKDNGIGIAPESIPLLFRPFYQVDPQREATEDGLGLGLSLVRSLIQMHGGSVEARSEGTGQGSEFIVRWPLAEVFGMAMELAPSVALDAARVMADMAPRETVARRILLVEDNVFSARMLARILSEAGHTVQMAYNGPAALAAVEQDRPDVVLLDIGLPMMDGYEVARRLRAMPAMAETMLVALTGYGREEDRDNAFSSGFDHHLIKPVDFDALLNLLAGNHAGRMGQQ